MCGVVGYIGDKNAVDILMDGLEKLEYRGYDSAGIAVNSYFDAAPQLGADIGIDVIKTKGRIADLRKILPADLSASIGIGHTRWATHGEPSIENAHPHSSEDSSIAVIHNGIVENYKELKDWLIGLGYNFNSDTDTEVIVHLVHHFYDGNLTKAVYEAVSKMRGAYAIGVLCVSEPEKIVVYRKDSPLLIGLGEDENFIASDIPAILKYTKKILFLENDELAEIYKDSVFIYDELMQEVKRDVYEVDWDADTAEKDGFEHFTLKEIYEQPVSLKNTIERRLDNNEIVVEGIRLSPEEIKSINRIYICGCGTAYYAGLVGKRVIEMFAKVPVISVIGSEFVNDEHFIDENTLFIAVTQSGETIDTLLALRDAKEKGAKILSIVNVVGSSIARESDHIFYTWAGPEIGVASTKAYTSQVACLTLFSLLLAKHRGMRDEKIMEVVRELLRIPDSVKKALELRTHIEKIAYIESLNKSIFFIGRGLDADLALEASLKFRELTYINASSVPAGELKHGTIALIEEGSLIVVFATQKDIEHKVASNIREVKARGAKVILITLDSMVNAAAEADETIVIPDIPSYLAAIVGAIPAQMLAYFASLALGNDVDKPRNLAKSVTVE